MISVRFQGKPFNMTVIQVYVPTADAGEAEVDQFYEDLQHHLGLTPKKRCPFHHGGLKCKTRKSRDTRNNRKVWPWSTKWSMEKGNRVLSRMHWSWQTPFSNNPRGNSTHGHHQMANTEIRLIMFFAAKDGETLYSQQKQVLESWLWLRSWTPYCKIQA